MNDDIMRILSDVAAVIEEQDETIIKQQQQIKRLESDMIQLLGLIEEGKNEV